MAAFSTPEFGRRRVLRLFAGTGAALLSGSAAAPAAPLRWTGTALGAEAQMLFAGGTGQAVRQAIAACRGEIHRLENEFSLYRPQSALSRLNRDGVLPNPTADMRALLLLAQRIGRLSGGAFDVSVQPLWQLYAEHFAGHPGDRDGPPVEAIVATRRRIDGRRIDIGSGTIRLGSGMALTLNGIAQGYITDRVADLLRRRGWRHVLVELGELRALDGRSPDRPWQVETPAGRLALADRAVAVSAGIGTPFEPSGRHHHLLDPTSGAAGQHYLSVTVTAARAAIADALSTAVSLMAPADAIRLLANFPDAKAEAVMPDGRIFRLSA